MSLHLIESRGSSRSAARNGGGTTASVVVHAMFATAILAFATNSPARFVSKPLDQPMIFSRPVILDALPASRTMTTAKNTGTNGNSLGAPRTTPSEITIPDIGVAPVTIASIGESISSDGRGGSNRSGNAAGQGNGSGLATGAIHDGLQVDKAVAPLPGARSPRYPEALRTAGIQDTVLASFVVDANGRVEPSSFEVKNTPHTPFIGAVRDALLATKFQPAEADGHAVRQRVVQAFVLSLSH